MSGCFRHVNGNEHSIRGSVDCIAIHDCSMALRAVIAAGQLVLAHVLKSATFGWHLAASIHGPVVYRSKGSQPLFCSGDEGFFNNETNSGGGLIAESLLTIVSIINLNPANAETCVSVCGHCGTHDRLLGYWCVGTFSTGESIQR